MRTVGRATRLSEMAAIPLSDIRKLSVTERIQLVEEIWDTVVDEAADGTIKAPKPAARD